MIPLSFFNAEATEKFSTTRTHELITEIPGKDFLSQLCDKKSWIVNETSINREISRSKRDFNQSEFKNLILINSEIDFFDDSVAWNWI